MENGNKKNSVLTSFWVGQSSAVLGAKLAALKPFYAWVARVAIVCIQVHECPSRHRHQEERSVLQFFFVAPRNLQELRAEVVPRAACRSCAPGNGIRMCARVAVCALAWKHMVRIILFACGWPAGCLAVEI